MNALDRLAFKSEYSWSPPLTLLHRTKKWAMTSLQVVKKQAFYSVLRNCESNCCHTTYNRQQDRQEWWVQEESSNRGSNHMCRKWVWHSTSCFPWDVGLSDKFGQSKSGISEPRSCVKVEVAILGSLPLIVWRVSVDIKQLWTWTEGSQSPGEVWRGRWSWNNSQLDGLFCCWVLP